MMRLQAIGGQLLEAEVNGHSLFYCSPLSFQGKTARGGVPVCFPQFNMLGDLPKHGFARHDEWKLAFSGQNEIGYELNIEPDTWPAWPYKAKITLTYQCTATGMFIGFEVFNLDNVPFSFTAGLHPYFKVNNLLDIGLMGLQGSGCKNLYTASQTHLEQEVLVFNHQPFETCFSGVSPLVLAERGKYRLHIQATGFTHWMVWNPGEQGALNLSDLPNEGWQEFICIEPILGEPCILGAYEHFKGTLEIKINE
ncbi:MAG: hypothetical protein C0424_12010 [Sphingobacteriaceae bacterium]|nr:hypothetical protein [Sphingobacteriaceae bacterium]